MLGDGQRQEDKAKTPPGAQGSGEALAEGRPTPATPPRSDAGRGEGEDAKPFHVLEEQLTARLGPLPPRVKRKVPEPSTEKPDGAATDEATSSDETKPKEGIAPLSLPEGRALLFTPTTVTLAPTRSPLLPLAYAAAGAAGLLIALAGWRLFDVDSPVASRAAVVSAAPDELLRSMQALQQERAKVDVLTRELAVARRELGAQATTAPDTVDPAEKAALEKKVFDLQENLRKAEALSGILDTLLSEERRHNIALANQATITQAAAEMSAASKPADGAGQPPASAAVVRDTVARDAPVVAAAPAVATVPAAVEARPEPVVAPAPAAVVAPVGAPIVAPIAAPIVPPAKTEPAAKAVPAASPASAPSARMTQRLLDKARQLLAQGEIGTARAVLEQVVEPAGAPALFALAETYDPAVLAKWGTVGTLGDVARARELYTRALVAGAPEAKARLLALP